MNDVVSELMAIASRYPADIAPRFEAASTPGELADLECVAGIPISGEVRAFFECHRAIIAMDIRNGYWLGGPVSLARSIRRGDFPTAIETEAGRVRVLPVGADGGGNAFLATTRGDVWRWDHDTGHVSLTAKSFAAFLRRVAEDWEHDLGEDDAWTYLV